MYKHTKRLLFALLVVGIIAAAWFGYGRGRIALARANPAQATLAPGRDASQVSASGKIVPVRWTPLSFTPGGQVEVLVEEGQTVAAGQVLARLDDAEQQHAVHAAKASLALAEADLAQLKAGTRPEDLAAAQSALDAAQAQLAGATAERDRLVKGAQAADLSASQAALDKAQADLKIAQDTYEAVSNGRSDAKQYGVKGRGLGAAEEQMRAQLEAARQARDAAQVRLNGLLAGAGDEVGAASARVAAALAQREGAQAALDKARAGATPEARAAAQARVEMARAALERAQAALDQTTLRAPFAGTVAGRLARSGEFVAPGQPALIVADLSAWQVETDDLSEEDVARVQAGQAVTITLDALPGVRLAGRVSRIAPKATAGQGGTDFTVTIAVEGADARIRWGMTAYPAFED